MTIKLCFLLLTVFGGEWNVIGGTELLYLDKYGAAVALTRRIPQVSYHYTMCDPEYMYFVSLVELKENY